MHRVLQKAFLTRIFNLRGSLLTHISSSAGGVSL